jgi:hypothetical protein
LEEADEDTDLLGFDEVAPFEAALTVVLMVEDEVVGVELVVLELGEGVEEDAMELGVDVVEVAETFPQAAEAVIGVGVDLTLAFGRSVSPSTFLGRGRFLL